MSKKKTFNKGDVIMKKTLSFILAVLMIMATMPVALAADPIALTTANVTEWPTAEYKDGQKLYFGQKDGDVVSWSGGKVEYNGTVVPGHFEFIEPDFVQEEDGEIRANIKFIPDDSSAYSGFESKRTRNARFEVTATNPMFVDKENDPVTTTEAEMGVALRTLTLSGGKMYNPYNDNEPNIKTGKWSWIDPSATVNESGYYDVVFRAMGYVNTTAQVYVRIAGDIPETQIIEMPTLPENLAYDGVTTWDKLELTGGKAVTKGDNKEIAGKFTINEMHNNRIIMPGDFSITVNFTPDDPEAALPYSFKLSGTVAKGTVNFVDENGNVIVPEITLDRILKVDSDLNGYLNSYLNTTAAFNWKETAGYRETLKPGTHELTVKTICDNPNYERYNYLTVKFNVNKEKITGDIQGVFGQQYLHFNGAYILGGSYDVTYYIDGEKAGVLEGIKRHEKFAIPADKSGVYTLDVVYNPAADDVYEVTVISPEVKTIILKHNVIVNGTATEYDFGATVNLTAPVYGDGEKPYYLFANWEVSDELAATVDGDKITFTMPDEDVELKANYKFDFIAFIKWIISQIKAFFESIKLF